MLFRLIICALFLTTACLVAQPSLKPRIGSGRKPASSDSIEHVPALHTTPGSANESPGLHTGDTVPGFVLFDAVGKPLDIQKELSKGKPVFLVAGSYTCPHFRRSLNALEQLMQAYGKEISFFVVYTIEAHPGFPDACPYSNEYSPVKENYKQHIEYRQPNTYGERKDLAQIMQKNLRQPAPVFFDAPDNAWWLNFGPLPNVAYLITPKGQVFSKAESLHNSYEQVVKDIERLLRQKP